MPGTVTHTALYWRNAAFRPAFEELAARFRLIQYDARGQADSSRGLRGDLTPEDWELDVEAAVDAQHLDRFILFAISSNGYAAVTYSLKHPERIEALVLWNVPLLGKTAVPSSLDEMAEENWEFSLEATGRMTFLWEDPVTAAEMVRQTWNQADWSTRARAWREAAIEGHLANLRVPTLLMATRRKDLRFGTEEDLGVPDTDLKARAITRARRALFLILAERTPLGPADGFFELLAFGADQCRVRIALMMDAPPVQYVTSSDGYDVTYALGG
jgi:pimeloyl-ACP methyl ester carboxylesterase